MDNVRAMNLTHCIYCKDPLDISTWGYYRKGTAWFKKQKARAGTNSAAMVEWVSLYACSYCIQKMLDGISVDQMSLFHLPESDD